MNLKERLKAQIKKIDAQKLVQDLTQKYEQISAKILQKQGAAFYGKLITVVLCAYFLSNITALIASNFIPKAPASRALHGWNPDHKITYNDYGIIFTRNLFSSKGIIPGEDVPDANTPEDLDGPPAKTTLPFELEGVILMQDEMHSIATILDKSQKLAFPVRIQDEIPNKAKILKIEPARVTFRNLANGRAEFVEVEEDKKSTTPRLTVGHSNTMIEKISPTQYDVSRAEVDQTLSNLNNVLTQARAVPNFENGVPAGYKLFQIVPGSIYDKLGLHNGDVIQGLNGQTINDPGKAFEMLQDLKTSSHLELQVKRNGQGSTYVYDIH